MIRTFGLTHTALPVADLERSQRFYQDLLGVEVRSRSADWADIGTPGCHDVISLQQVGADGARGEMGSLGHIGFRLKEAEDIAVLVAAVEAAGGVVVEKGHFTPDEPYVFLKDPDGYNIELWHEP